MRSGVYWFRSALAPISVILASGDPQVAVVTLSGEQDSYSASRLESALALLLDRGSSVAVDLQSTSFIDSTTLAALLGARARAQEEDAGFVLVLPSEPTQAHRILELTRLDSEFAIYDAVDDGVAAARAGETGAVRSAP
jgi:anti-anti-sigma factor